MMIPQGVFDSFRYQTIEWQIFWREKGLVSRLISETVGDSKSRIGTNSFCLLRFKRTPQA
jgi:hypothetical protein